MNGDEHLGEALAIAGDLVDSIQGIREGNPIVDEGTRQADPKESPAELAAWIDARLQSSWRAKGLPTRDVASDEVFLRRAYLELTGTLPSVAEARDFLESTSASKRELLIRTLLDDKRFAEQSARL